VPQVRQGDSPRLGQVQGKKRPIAKRLDPLMPEIHHMVLDEGVPISEIAEELTQQGIEVTAGYLKTLMYRYRKKQKRKGGGESTTKVEEKYVPRQAPTELGAQQEAEADDGNQSAKVETEQDTDDHAPGGGLNDVLNARNRKDYGRQYENRKSLIPKRSRD